MKNLTDEVLLSAFERWRGGAMTYVIANVLDRKWPTATVRRRLQSMEKRGLVKRMPTGYATQICWALTAKAAPASTLSEWRQEGMQ